MRNWFGLFITFTLLISTGCNTKSLFPDPESKEFTHRNILVKHGDGSWASKINNIKMTVVKGNSSRTTTVYRIVFDTTNRSWDVNRSFQTALIVDFITESGSPVPAPNNRIVLSGWRDACYFGREGHKVYDGSFRMPYDEFISLAARIQVYDNGVRSRVGKCLN